MKVEDQKEYILKRYPPDNSEKLQAWNAADEYLIDFIHHELDLSEKASILVVNDNFGALTLGLHGYRLSVWSDSFCSFKAIESNLKANDLKTTSIEMSHDLSGFADGFDLVVLKIPKSLALLERQLFSARSIISEGTAVIGAGMTKTIHNSTIDLFERIIGSTKTSLAVKKSRLILSKAESREIEMPKENESFVFDDKVYQTKAGVFSHGKLDRGSESLIDEIGDLDPVLDVIDLGCGSGILGIELGFKMPKARIFFVDDSFQAIESAKENAMRLIPEQNTVFIHGDCLHDLDDNSADLILCNPPFHQNNSVTIGTAERMFRDSLRVLRKGGRLIVVGNSHLGYHKRLKNLFGNLTTLSSDSKYLVLSSYKV